MGTIGRVVTRCSSLRGQTGVNVGRFLGLLLSGTSARFVCHRFFLLVTAGACVLRCRSLRYPCTFCFCADCHYDHLRGFWLQRWVGGLLCFFLNTSFLATSGEAIQRCKGAPGVCLLRGVRRMPWQVRCTPSVPGPGLPGTPLSGFFSFSPKSHKRYGELLYSLLPCLQLCASLLTHRLFQRTSTFAAPLRGSVCDCSHEPGAGLRCPLMCCLVYLLTGLSPLQLCLPCHLLFV